VIAFVGTHFFKLSCSFAESSIQSSRNKQVEAFEAIIGKPRAQAEKILERIGDKTELPDEKVVEKAIILLEVPRDVHENLVLEAKKVHLSLEAFCVQTLQNQSLQNAENRGS
jgi:predicted HicB family RNase H-like nuclease